MFYKNITARRGGAAYSFEGTHDLGGSYTTDYIIDNDKFYGNYTSSEPTIVANGGAIYANEAPLTVQNCTFIENKTTQATSKGGQFSQKTVNSQAATANISIMTPTIRGCYKS